MSEECGSGPTPAPGTKRKEWGTLAWQLGIYRRRGSGYFEIAVVRGKQQVPPLRFPSPLGMRSSGRDDNPS